jgi:hypothetical protein
MVIDSPVPSKSSENQAQSSKYSFPEWRLFQRDDPSPKSQEMVESLLSRASSSNLAYGAFNEEEARAVVQFPLIPEQPRNRKSTQLSGRPFVRSTGPIEC